MKQSEGQVLAALTAIDELTNALEGAWDELRPAERMTMMDAITRLARVAQPGAPAAAGPDDPVRVAALAQHPAGQRPSPGSPSPRGFAEAGQSSAANVFPLTGSPATAAVRSAEDGPSTPLDSVAQTTGRRAGVGRGGERGLQLPAHPLSAGLASRFVTMTLNEWGLRTLIDGVSRATTDLVASALAGNQPEIMVVASRAGAGVRIEVHGSERLDGAGAALQSMRARVDACGTTESRDDSFAWFELAPTDPLLHRAAG